MRPRGEGKTLLPPGHDAVCRPEHHARQAGGQDGHQRVDRGMEDPVGLAGHTGPTTAQHIHGGGQTKEHSGGR